MMNWQCNIDKRGRYFRGVLGFLTLGAGIYLIFWTEHDFWGSGACALGAFALFEAIKGWCAIRAIGFETRF
ncbi:MAG TPA: hypothetical protein PK529_11485 [Verrucomicrobiales bacterium]|nr:hypothetical protein [Verrucomicrobiales bacterium]